jgi:glycosyltransferase involved in cell wall biosynthesis
MLHECLDSVVGQTYRPVEIVVVDDGSTDSTADVLKSFEEHVRELKDVSLRWKTTPNSGAPHARNVGVSLCSGEYIIFLDSDDILLPNRLEEDVGEFSKNPALQVVYSRAQCFGEDGSDLGRFVGSRHVRSQHDYFKLYWQTMCATYQAGFFRTTAGWDESLPMWQDYELCQRVLVEHMAVVEFVDKVLARHRYGTSYARIGQRDTIYALARKRYPAVIKIADLISNSGELRVKAQVKARLRILKCLAIFRANGDAEMTRHVVKDMRRFGILTYMLSMCVAGVPRWVFANFKDLL